MIDDSQDASERPTADEIEARAAKVRLNWSPRVEQRRRLDWGERFTVPESSLAGIPSAALADIIHEVGGPLRD